MDREKMREAIARAVFRGSLSPNERNDRYLLENSAFRDRHYETADAILAAIGTPDATGDLLMRAAERTKGATTAGMWFEVKRGVWSVSMYTCPTDDYLKPIGEGPTPADAIRAALAAAEEGR